MMMLIAAAALAAQTAPAGHAYPEQAQQSQMAEKPMMDCKQMMEDCKKCCEEMKAKHAASYGKSKHNHQ